MARAAWEAGRAAASSFGDVASEFVDDYSKLRGGVEGAGGVGGGGQHGVPGGQQGEVNASKSVVSDDECPGPC